MKISLDELQDSPDGSRNVETGLLCAYLVKTKVVLKRVPLGFRNRLIRVLRDQCTLWSIYPGSKVPT